MLIMSAAWAAACGGTQKMFKPTVLALLLTALAVSPAVRALPVVEEPAPGIDYREMTVIGNTQFALDLYGQLSKEKGNLFFSPYSISTALAMSWSGARNNTEKEMADTLHFPMGQAKMHQTFAGLEQGLAGILAKGDVSLSTANSLWPKAGLPLLDTYVRQLEQSYGVSLTPLDYVRETEAARRTINSWVEQKTREKIRELIRPGDLDPSTVMVLVNAIHFKGDWASKFKEKSTRPADFTLPDGTVKQVPTMYQEGRFDIGGDRDVELLELPYQGGDLSMLILLPRDMQGLAALESSLTPERLITLLGSLSEQKVNVWLPKFKFTWGTTDLVAPLQALGMKEAFGRQADFSGMDGQKGYFISLVLHKAFIEVNEQGSEAAAATAVIHAKSMPPMLRVNHPFIFLIRDNVSGSILFLGRVADPDPAG